MTQMQVLETTRLTIRPFVLDDLHDAHRMYEAAFHSRANADAFAEWLTWTVMNYEQLAGLYQPPYGDRAIVLKSSGQVVGSVGFVPCLMPFAQLPSFHESGPARFTTTEFGLFWLVDPAHRRQGYATEAARAMAEYAFTQLHLRRVVATIEYDNPASQGVARRIGMRIEHNPLPEPPWMQVVAVLDNTFP